MAVVVVVGGAMVLDRTLDVGVMVAFLFFIQRFFDPIRSLTMQYSVMQRAMASGQRLTEVLDVPVDVTDAPDAVVLPRHAPARSSSATWASATSRAIRCCEDVSFRVNPGETVALVGPTGSGKSSTMALIHRFYDVQRGRGPGRRPRRARDHRRPRSAARSRWCCRSPYLFTGTVSREHPLQQDRRDRGRRDRGGQGRGGA